MNPVQHIFILAVVALSQSFAAADQAGRKHAENELHARPAVSITVGLRDADIIGGDNRALQAAVDYVGNLGGGVVEIGPGEYLMRDSLHLRSRVTVRGAGEKTVLKKDREHRSPLAADGDFGEARGTLSTALRGSDSLSGRGVQPPRTLWQIPCRDSRRFQEMSRSSAFMALRVIGLDHRLRAEKDSAVNTATRVTRQQSSPRKPPLQHYPTSKSLATQRPN